MKTPITAPKRLREISSDPSDVVSDTARSLAQAGHDAKNWSSVERSALWSRIERSAKGTPLGGRRSLGWALMVAVPAVALAFFFRPRVENRLSTRSVASNATQVAQFPAPIKRVVDLGSIGTLEVTDETRYRLSLGAKTSDSQPKIFLDRGELYARIQKRDGGAPLIVVTPHLQVVVASGQFRLGVEVQSSTVNLELGGVKVEHEGRSVVLAPGQRIKSDDLRLRPMTKEVTKARSTLNSDACAELAPNELKKCYASEARGGGLRAQNALYTLGLLAREEGDSAGALSIWRSYQRRFPDGVLAREAAESILGELVSQGRNKEALVEAERYPFRPDGRSAEVRLIVANLLRTDLGCSDRVLTAYQSTLSAVGSGMRSREESLYQIGVCQNELGRRAEATAAWTRYRSDFPAGSHLAEVTRFLSTR